MQFKPSREPRQADGLPAWSGPGGAGRRGILMGLAASLAGCELPEHGLDILPPPPESVPEVAAAPMVESARVELADDADPVIEGQRLNGALLRRFYAARDFAPAWQAASAGAEALSAAVLRAGEHGLHPDLFGAALLRRIGDFPDAARELLLSHAVLTYAQALAGGAIPPARRHDVEALRAGEVDAAAALQAALESDDPVAAIEGLAPASREYQALRDALRRGETAERRRLLAVNLERQRWLPRQLPPDRVWVNITDQSLVLFRDDQPVFSTRVVVGAELPVMQSPEFETTINAAFLNPPWIIPDDILRRAILPRAAADPGYLVRRNITLTADGEAEQAAGPDSALGAIMFDMPNRFDVYLHDTPDRSAFELPNRRISNGCIRVENPLQLAALVMDKPLEEVQAKVATGDTREEAVPRPMPVFLVYQTAVLAAADAIEPRPDFYGRDVAIWQGLQPPGTVPSPAPVRPRARTTAPRRT